MWKRRFGCGGGVDFSAGGALVGVSTEGEGDVSLYEWEDFFDRGVASKSLSLVLGSDVGVPAADLA